MRTFGLEVEVSKEDGHEMRTLQGVHDSRFFRRFEG